VQVRHKGWIGAIVLGLVAIVFGTWLYFTYRQGDVRNEPLNGHPTASDEGGRLKPQGVPRDGPSPPTYPNVFDEGEMVDEEPQTAPSPAEEASPQPPAPIGLAGQLVSLLYATNRVVNASTNELVPAQVTSVRSPDLSFGSAMVRIPENHKFGEVDQPRELALMGYTIWREELNEKDHFVLGEIRPFTRQEFIATAGADKERSALVYVHGYNTDFVGAMFKLAQIVFDVNYTGLPVAFIWPSQGGVINYDRDREVAMASRESFRELLKILYQDAGLKKIHVIAHSMGNQVVVEGLNQQSLMHEDIKLSELILAAPDVDHDGFLAMAKRIRALVEGMTIYVSSSDKALRLSAFKAGGPRLGDSSANGPAIFPDVDTIDVTALGEDVFELNHDVFSAARSAIDDIGRVLQGVRPPGIRTPHLRGMPVGTTPPQYWRYPQ
jgi:esterase/lipase superfamily enzyme